MRFLGQGPGENDPLSFAPAELGNKSIRVITHPGFFHDVAHNVDIFGGGCGKSMYLRIPSHHHHFFNGKGKVDIIILRHQGNGAGKLFSAPAGQGPSPQQHLSSGGFQVADENIEQGCFTAAVGSEDGIKPARLQFKVDIP